MCCPSSSAFVVECPISLVFGLEKGASDIIIRHVHRPTLHGLSNSCLGLRNKLCLSIIQIVSLIHFS
jgi:hypothetical protein